MLPLLAAGAGFKVSLVTRLHPSHSGVVSTTTYSTPHSPKQRRRNPKAWAAERALGFLGWKGGGC